MTDLELIEAIQTSRARNNVYWMDLVRLAVEVAPERARSIFKKIAECDEGIHKMIRELAE